MAVQGCPGYPRSIKAAQGLVKLMEMGMNRLKCCRALLTLLTLLTLLSATAAHARTFVVEAVVSPAWVERAGKREPLTVGLVLNDNDKVITGERARVLLRMSEGSAVKLGENATLGLSGIAEKKAPDNSPLVSASLDVLKGAFRFTTGVFGNPRVMRDIGVKFSTITAGVRGTDLWGRSSGTDDVVCLLEGKITVRHDNKEIAMNEALQTFVVPRNEKPRPLAKVSQQQSDEWSRETEIIGGQGAVRAGGKVRLEFLRTADENLARDLETRLKAAGYPAVIDPVRSAQGAAQYAVSVLGIATNKDRDALLARLKSVTASAASTEGARK